MVDEAERSLHDALSVLSQTTKETRTVLGGGCSEMLMSNAVEEAGRKVAGKKAIAVEAFGRALRQVCFNHLTQLPRSYIWVRYLLFSQTTLATTLQILLQDYEPLIMRARPIPA